MCDRIFCHLCAGKFKYGSGVRWYFFTTKPKHDVVTKDGYWNSLSVEEIVADYKVIGFKRKLVFYHGNLGSGTKTRWMIREYSAHANIFATSELDESTKEKVISSHLNTHRLHS